MCRAIVENLLSGTKAGFKATRNLVFNQKAERSTMNRQKSRAIVENVLSGIKACFKAILNYEHPFKRKKMKNQINKSTFSAILLTLTLMVAALGVSSAVGAEKKMVKDPTTGKMVSEPEYGGRLTYVLKTYASQTDPYFGWSDILINGVAEKLGIGNWGIDRDEWDFNSGPLPVFAITGRLAESWEIPDSTTFIFHIRDGVRWHKKAPMNGRLLTAQDVEYNFHRMLGLGSGFTEPTPFGGVSPLKAIPFESITATDDSTVVMKLKEPYLPALKLILSDYFVYIMPPEVIKEHGDVKDWRNLVGTGPFELTEFVEESRVTWTKNPDYWGTDEKYPENRLPYVDELRFSIIPEETTILAAVRSGKIDFVPPWALSTPGAESLQQTNPELVPHEWWFRSNYAFATQMREPPFDDIRVRQAMQMALDLETINSTFFKGQGDTTPMGMVGVKGYYIPFEEWPEEVKKGYRYDPEGAGKLLDEAGYPRGADGTRFNTVVRILGSVGGLSYVEIAVFYWAKIGVEVEIVYFEDWAAYHEEVFAGTYKGVMGTIAGASGYDPAMLVGWHRSDAQWNRPGSKWPELDALVEAALAATTIEEQQRLVKEADMYAIEKHWQMWGPKLPQLIFHQPWVIGFNGEAMHLGPLERHEIFVRLWIDSALKEEMGR